MTRRQIFLQQSCRPFKCPRRRSSAPSRSFPTGSAGSPDGIRPQHLVKFILSQEAYPPLLSSITALVNDFLDGRCPQDIVQLLFGGRLIAMDKKSGGIRPIVVRYIWRSLAAKCASVHAINTLADYFSPLQLGVGVPGGCEAAVHTARRFTSNMRPDNIFVKVNSSNAFNCLYSEYMLERVSEVVSEL